MSTTNLCFNLGLEKSDIMESFYQLCLMKYFLLCSLSILLIQGAPTTTDIERDEPQNAAVISVTHLEYEIRSSCSLSPRCQQTYPITVDPDSNIPPNCSIIAEGLVEGMTWKEAKQAVQNITGTSDLFLQKVLTDNGKYSCQCVAVNFTRALQIVWVTSSPNFITEGEPKDLECYFSGWPLPREVFWSKNGDLIINGTDGIYHSEGKKWKNGEETLHSILHLPDGREEREGYYTCSATNSIPGWSSRGSFVIQLLYECPIAEGLTANSSNILVNTFTNVSLTCWVDNDWVCPDYLFWYLNDNPKPLPKSSEKYKVEVKATHTQCKKKFVLSIFNVTKNDEGTYSCHWLCEYETTSTAAIDLKVVDNSQTGILEAF